MTRNKFCCSILILVLCFISTVLCHSKVLLRDVQTLTLNRGQYTTGRRNAPVPQLRCVGGSAQGQYTPAVVQCYNRGSDGRDAHWECKADMPREYEFGRISVTCEGFDYPDDPYILAGSCGLEYELNQSPLGSASYGKKTPSAPYADDDSFRINWEGIIYFAVICFIIYLVYLVLSGPREGFEGDRNRGDSWYPGGGGGGPNPPGWRPPPPPPSYDDATKRSSTTNQNAAPGGGGPGFWTGLGMGALGGYLYGNNTGEGWFRRRNNYHTGPTQFERDTGFYNNPSSSTHGYGFRDSSPGPSSSRHTSTSFGGTTRR